MYFYIVPFFLKCEFTEYASKKCDHFDDRSGSSRMSDNFTKKGGGEIEKKVFPWDNGFSWLRFVHLHDENINNYDHRYN